MSDRDAAYYKYVYGRSLLLVGSAQRDLPQLPPLGELYRRRPASAGQAVIVWQVPEGNQYFDTENNTDGHYQDNRAEYFFGHVGELAQAPG